MQLPGGSWKKEESSWVVLCPPGLKRSGVHRPLCSSRPYLHTAFLAQPVASQIAQCSLGIELCSLSLPPCLPGWSQGIAFVHQGALWALFDLSVANQVDGWFVTYILCQMLCTLPAARCNC